MTDPTILIHKGWGLGVAPFRPGVRIIDPALIFDLALDHPARGKEKVSGGPLK
jgi:hypothetical protein